MPSTRTFSGVTPEILHRMKEFGRAEYNIVYDPPEGPVSTATARRRSASAWSNSRTTRQRPN